MMFNKIIIRNNLIAFAAMMVPAMVFGVPGIGLAALLLGLINAIFCLAYFIAGQINNALTILICMGVLLLIGYSICSTFNAMIQTQFYH